MGPFASPSQQWRFLLLFTTTTLNDFAAFARAGDLLVADASIDSMHTVVTRFNNVVLLNRTNIGPTHLRLPTAIAGSSPQYRPQARLLRPLCNARPRHQPDPPLTILTDTWCSSG
ncbi:hypothetical protein NL676_032957 [Syzygium grande]|nr:hypothetical protein NL676_032957 [Syzygium grande]